MRCEHWFKFDGVCKHCGYQEPIPDLGLVPLRTKAPQANRAGVVKPIIPVMRTVLVEIQELHKPCKMFSGREVCDVCNTETGKPVTYPCPTRKLANAGLEGAK